MGICLHMQPDPLLLRCWPLTETLGILELRCRHTPQTLSTKALNSCPPPPSTLSKPYLREPESVIPHGSHIRQTPNVPHPHGLVQAGRDHHFQAQSWTLNFELPEAAAPERAGERHPPWEPHSSCAGPQCPTPARSGPGWQTPQDRPWGGRPHTSHSGCALRQHSRAVGGMCVGAVVHPQQ